MSERIEERSSVIARETRTRKGFFGKILRGQRPLEQIASVPRKAADTASEALEDKSGLRGTKTRREFLRWAAGFLVATGGGTLGWFVVRPIAKNLIEESTISEELVAGEIRWVNLLQREAGSVDAVRLTINQYCSEDLALGDYQGWINSTEFGFYVQGLHLFVDHLRTKKGRDELLGLVEENQGKYDLQGAKDRIKAVDEYAGGGKLDWQQLETYFKENLGYSDQRWRDIMTVYQAVETKNGALLQQLMATSAAEVAETLGVKESVVQEVAAGIEKAGEILETTGADQAVDLATTVAIAETIPVDYTAKELQIAMVQIVSPSHFSPPAQGFLSLPPGMGFALAVGVVARYGAPRLKDWSKRQLEKLGSSKKK